MIKTKELIKIQEEVVQRSRNTLDGFFVGLDSTKVDSFINHNMGDGLENMWMESDGP